jgi:hypothetical protein
MSRIQYRLLCVLLAEFLLCTLLVPPARAQDPAQGGSSAAPLSPSAAQSTGKAATVADIAAAKAAGKVWVNLDTGIYHKGGRWYGKTKDGKFMTQAEAKAAGYKPAKRD